VDASGLGVLAVGLVLCFLGVRSLRGAVLASGFALGWLLAEPFGAGLATAFIVAGAAALAGVLLATLVFRVAFFFVGAIAGAVIGAKLFGILQQGEGSVVIAVLFVLASAFLAGLAAQRFTTTALAVVCAAGGAGLVLSGIARTIPGTLGFLRIPNVTWEAIVAAVAWIALATIGCIVQRRSTSRDRVARRPRLGRSTTRRT
jgi:hypothetical protein